jgi:tRNA wybutosine-synthesizing protein 1
MYSPEHFNAVARRADRHLANLSADRFVTLGLGDENTAGSKHGSIENDFEAWKAKVVHKLAKEAGECCFC